MASEGLEGRFLWECRTRTAAGLRLTKQFLLYSQTDSSSSPPSIEPRRPRSSSYCSVGGERNVKKKIINSFHYCCLSAVLREWKFQALTCPLPFPSSFSACVVRPISFCIILLKYGNQVLAYKDKRRGEKRQVVLLFLVLLNPSFYPVWKKN